MPDDSDLHSWTYTGAEDDDVTVARMEAHPAFAAACHALARNMLAAAEADKALNGIFMDVGRYAVAFIAIHLHLTGGLTLPRLKALTIGSGLSSPGRARAVLLYMRYLGFVTRGARTPGEPDLFVLTPRCEQAWSTHLMAAVRSAAVIDPAVLPVLAAFDRPEVYRTFATVHGAMLMSSFTRAPKRETPFFKSFLHRHAGSFILWTLILADESGSFPPLRTRPLAISDMARRFGVSRPHIRRMFEASGRDGMLTRDGDAVVFEASVRTFLSYLYATQMVWLVAAAARTLEAHPDLSQASATR